MQNDNFEHQVTFASEILRATTDYFVENSSSVLMGLGVTDPKAVFGTTSGLIDKFGSSRIIETPTSENAMTGIGVGLAISGHTTILVHQRLDFFLLAMDQLVNSASKWNYMFGGNQNVPLTIRLILGHGWGQGPTHSQNLHAWFSHIPGLKILFPAFAEDVYPMFLAALRDPNPVIFLEDRWLHNQYVNRTKLIKDSKYRIGSGRLVNRGDRLTIIASGYSTILALKAVEYLADQNIKVDLIDLRSLKPVDSDLIVKSVQKTGNALILDSGNEFAGYSNEILKIVIQNCFNSLRKPPAILAGLDVPEPTSHGVIKYFKFGTFEIVERVYCLLGEKIPANCSETLNPKLYDVPDSSFKGPF